MNQEMGYVRKVYTVCSVLDSRQYKYLDGAVGR